MQQDKYLTLEEMWAKQQLCGVDMDYTYWNQQRDLLVQMSDISGSCIFAVDVYKCRYSFVSKSFTEIFGYDASKIATIEKQGDYFESRFHPDDHDKLLDLQIMLGNFIYNLAPEQRNDYQNIFQFRVLNAENKYVNVISRHHVLLKDRNAKAWVVMGVMDVSPDQSLLDHVKCTVVNRKTGEIFTPSTLSADYLYLTKREKEIVRLIKEGALSKEIAERLKISIHTVNNHRKNILGKLNADNFIEAINMIRKYNL